MSRATVLLPVFFLLLTISIFHGSWLLHPYTTVKLLLKVGFDEKELQYSYFVSTGPVAFVIVCVSAVCLHFMMKYSNIVEERLGQFIGGSHGFAMGLLSTLIQMGRYVFFHENLSMIIYMSNVYIILTLFLDLFSPRNATTEKLLKVNKRCIFGVVLLVSHERTFVLRLWWFALTLPAALFPLVPAFLAWYTMEYCVEDPPQHGLVPDWFGWRDTGSEST